MITLTRPGLSRRRPPVATATRRSDRPDARRYPLSLVPTRRLDRDESSGAVFVIGRKVNATGGPGSPAFFPTLQQPVRADENRPRGFDLQRRSLDVAPAMIDDLPRDRLDGIGLFGHRKPPRRSSSYAGNRLHAGGQHKWGDFGSVENVPFLRNAITVACQCTKWVMCLSGIAEASLPATQNSGDPDSVYGYSSVRAVGGAVSSARRRSR
jgi:hypothetical protein